MEDAIAINSASYNRGFGEGAIIKSEVTDKLFVKVFLSLDNKFY